IFSLMQKTRLLPPCAPVFQASTEAAISVSQGGGERTPRRLTFSPDHPNVQLWSIRFPMARATQLRHIESMHNSRPASYRAVTGLALVVACLFPFTACSEEGSEPLDADEGSGGTESGSGGAGEASGGAIGSGGQIGSGGEAAECSAPRPLSVECIADLDPTRELCFTLEELNDPCSATHLWEVHEGMGGEGGMGGRG